MIYQFVVNGPIGAKAKITLSPTSGPPGTTVTVSGSGFPANTDVEIILLGPAAETVSDSSGDFTTTFDVPHTPFTGIHDVMAAGGAFSDSAQFRSKGVERPDSSAEIPGRPARGELHRCWRRAR